MLARILFLVGVLFSSAAVAADNATLITPCASGCVTMRSRDVGSGVQSMIQILGDIAGAPIATAAGTPNTTSVLPIQGTTGGTAVPVSAAALPLPTGAATSALQTTINTTLGSPMQTSGGSVTANAGTNLNTSALALENGGNLATLAGTVTAARIAANARITGNAGAIMDFAGQNASSPANAMLMGAQFQTTPTTITAGNSSPLQMDNAGNLLVNIKAGAGSGGTALADGATFTQGTTNETPIGCLFINSYTAITTGKIGVVSCTSAGSVHTTVDNTNANGQATMANSSPVVIASNQSNLPTNTAQVNGVTVLTGTGPTGTGAQRVTISTDQATNAGAALVKGGVGVVNGGSGYQAVAASQTAAVLQSSTGATGDYLSHCDIYPASTSPGVVTVFDNTNTAANSAILFPGGASSTSNLVPIAVPVGAISANGAWKVTTGANVSVVCYGKFS